MVYIEQILVAPQNQATQLAPQGALPKASLPEAARTFGHKPAEIVSRFGFVSTGALLRATDRVCP